MNETLTANYKLDVSEKERLLELKKQELKRYQEMAKRCENMISQLKSS